VGELLNVVAGFAVGVLVGLTGVGGGALMTPVLVLLFGMAPSSAVGTDLWFAALTKSVGGALHKRQGTVDWPVVRLLWAGSLPASALTLWWLHSRTVGHAADRLVLPAMGVVLMATALALLLKPQLHRWLGAGPVADAPSDGPAERSLATVMAGALLGFLVTLTSIGAGALGAVMLVALHPRRMTPRRLVGTDIVHAVPLTLLAGVGYLSMGQVEFGLLAWLLLGSVPGIVLGSLAGRHAPEHVLRRLIAVVLALVGTRLILKA
jgi:hypothetical protein